MSNHGLLLGSCGLNLGWAAGARAAGGWHVSVVCRDGRCRVPAGSPLIHAQPRAGRGVEWPGSRAPSWCQALWVLSAWAPGFSELQLQQAGVTDLSKGFGSSSGTLPSGIWAEGERRQKKK